MIPEALSRERSSTRRLAEEPAVEKAGLLPCGEHTRRLAVVGRHRPRGANRLESEGAIRRLLPTEANL